MACRQVVSTHFQGKNSLSPTTSLQPKYGYQPGDDHSGYKEVLSARAATSYGQSLWQPEDHFATVVTTLANSLISPHLYGHCLLLFYILATSKVVLRWGPICDSAHSWWRYGASSLGNQATSTMTWYPAQSHNHDTELTSPWPILIMPSTWLTSDKYQFYKALVWLDRGFLNARSSAREKLVLLIQPLPLVIWSPWLRAVINSSDWGIALLPAPIAHLWKRSFGKCPSLPCLMPALRITNVLRISIFL